MKKYLIFLFSLIILLLSACGSSEHSVSWWEEQKKDVLQEKVKKCNDKASKSIEADCINAQKAFSNKKFVGDKSEDKGKTMDIRIK